MSEKETTDITKWEAELAADANVAAAAVAQDLGGQFFSVKPGGIMYWAGNQVPGNQIASVVACYVHEHAFYPGGYDPDNLTSPVCFAFGNEDEKMAPHANSSQRQAETCAECPRNKFPSKEDIARQEAEVKAGRRAQVRKGKECKNILRLALLSAGTLDGPKFDPHLDPEYYETVTPGFMRVPVTSVKNFASYVVQMKTVRSRAPYALFTKISTRPHTKNQSEYLFEQLEPLKLPTELEMVLRRRSKDLEPQLVLPYQSVAVDEAPAAEPAAAAGKKTAAKKRTKFAK